MRSDHRHLTAYQIGCEVGQSVVLVLRPAILNRHILALDVTGFTNALAECGHKTCSVGGRRVAKKPDHRHRGLLRARRERPRRRAAGQRDQLASSWVEHGLLPGTRRASLPPAQDAPEAPAAPWG